MTERAISWFMNQFDSTIVFQALNNIPPGSRTRSHHQLASWGLYRLLREDIKTLEDESVNEKGQPMVTPALKLALRDRLRTYLVVGGSLHQKFLHDIGKLGPHGGTDYDDNGPEEEKDPIVLSLKRNVR